MRSNHLEEKLYEYVTERLSRKILSSRKNTLNNVQDAGEKLKN